MIKYGQKPAKAFVRKSSLAWVFAVLLTLRRAAALFSKAATCRLIFKRKMRSMERSYPKFTVTEKAESNLRKGHPWVYAEEIEEKTGAYENGDIVDVISRKGRYLGSGFVNDYSKICVRLLSTNANDRFDEAFFERRLRWALDYRKTVMGDDFSACRLVFGEADGLPGFTVDKFGSVLSVQVLCLGIEKRKDMLFSLLCRLLCEMGEAPLAIYERNDLALREKEGLPEAKGFYQAPGLADDLDGHVTISENGLLFDVDYIHGQKTGFFLDQKYNRLAIRRIARGRRVLDCFTHTGGFALNAAFGGASATDAVDVSADALAEAEKNAERNGLSVTFMKADVFDLLRTMEKEKRHEYDFIILDPPAFTKSYATIRNAYGGYKEINRLAMKLLPRGGYLATCSCSHFMRESLFKQMLHEASREANVSLRQIEGRRQSFDHPILWNVPETDYLKFFIFQVV